MESDFERSSKQASGTINFRVKLQSRGLRGPEGSLGCQVAMFGSPGLGIWLGRAGGAGETGERSQLGPAQVQLSWPLLGRLAWSEGQE